MNRITKGETVTLDNGKEYIAVEVVEQGDKRYPYLVNEELKEVIIAEEIIEGKDLIVKAISDVNKMKEIAKIVVERLS